MMPMWSKLQVLLNIVPTISTSLSTFTKLPDVNNFYYYYLDYFLCCNIWCNTQVLPKEEKYNRFVTAIR